MAIKKKYFIWKCSKKDDFNYHHPNTNHERVERWKTKGIIIQEYAYQQNGWYLGHIEWDNTKITAAKLLEHAEEFVNYDFKVKTPLQVITLLNTFYPSEEEAYFSLDTDGFTLIDNQPIEEMI